MLSSTARVLRSRSSPPRTSVNILAFWASIAARKLAKLVLSAVCIKLLAGSFFKYMFSIICSSFIKSIIILVNLSESILLLINCLKKFVCLVFLVRNTFALNPFTLNPFAFLGCPCWTMLSRLFHKPIISVRTARVAFESIIAKSLSYNLFSPTINLYAPANSITGLLTK